MDVLVGNNKITIKTYESSMFLCYLHLYDKREFFI